jgi:transposase-like protein
MARSEIDHVELSLPCPKCRRVTKETVGWVRTHNHFVCQGCDAQVTLTTNELERDIAQLERDLANLKRSIKSIGKRR